MYLFLILPCLLLFSGCERLFQNPPKVPISRFNFPAANPLEEAELSLARQPRVGIDYPPLKGLEAELKRVLPKSNKMEIYSSLMMAITQYQEDTGVPPEEMYCMRDYTLPCPERWTDLGDGETCLAADGFEEDGCEQEEKLGKLTVAGKREFADRCKSKWPCYNKCVEDFSSPCPIGWGLKLNVGCIAPREYTGKCLTNYYLADHNLFAKYEWSRICQVTWPCRGPQINDVEMQLRAPVNKSMTIRRVNYPGS